MKSSKLLDTFPLLTAWICFVFHFQLVLLSVCLSQHLSIWFLIFITRSLCTWRITCSMSENIRPGHVFMCIPLHLCDRLALTPLHLIGWIFCLSVSIVMGVPSVKREVHSYLTDTLSSLMSELSQAEKDDCVIVVFIAEVGLGFPWRTALL